jgi:hypothetical protein
MCCSPSDPIRLSRPRASMLAVPFPPCVVVPIRSPHSPLSPVPTVPHRAYLLRPPPRRISHRAQSTWPATTVLPPRRGQPAHRDCLHRASASTTDAPASSWGGWDCVTPRPLASCLCRCRTARSMRRRRPPRRRASVRLSKAHVARVCFKCFILMLQK